jgi:hypothetical protein
VTPPGYHVSPDGRFYWDGHNWQPIQHQARPQHSPDGRWWWDGIQWIAIAAAEAVPAVSDAAATSHADVAGATPSADAPPTIPRAPDAPSGAGLAPPVAAAAMASPPPPLVATQAAPTVVNFVPNKKGAEVWFTNIAIDNVATLFARFFTTIGLEFEQGTPYIGSYHKGSMWGGLQRFKLTVTQQADSVHASVTSALMAISSGTSLGQERQSRKQIISQLHTFLNTPGNLSPASAGIPPLAAAYQYTPRKRHGFATALLCIVEVALAALVVFLIADRSNTSGPNFAAIHGLNSAVLIGAAVVAGLGLIVVAIRSMRVRVRLLIIAGGALIIGVVVFLFGFQTQLSGFAMVSKPLSGATVNVYSMGSHGTPGKLLATTTTSADGG